MEAATPTLTASERNAGLARCAAYGDLRLPGAASLARTPGSLAAPPVTVAAAYARLTGIRRCRDGTLRAEQWLQCSDSPGPSRSRIGRPQ
jgi:hypothetical protein